MVFALIISQRDRKNDFLAFFHTWNSFNFYSNFLPTQVVLNATSVGVSNFGQVIEASEYPSEIIIFIGKHQFELKEANEREVMKSRKIKRNSKSGGQVSRFSIPDPQPSIPFYPPFPPLRLPLSLLFPGYQTFFGELKLNKQETRGRWSVSFHAQDFYMNKFIWRTGLIHTISGIETQGFFFEYVHLKN